MKRFSQLAIPYIVWAAMMLVLPMALIALYSITEPGKIGRASCRERV